jgi:hypothetical protein
MVWRRGALAGAVVLAVVIAMLAWRLSAATPTATANSSVHTERGPAQPGGVEAPPTAAPTPNDSVRAERGPAQPGGVEAPSTPTPTDAAAPAAPVRPARPPVNVAGWERARLAFGFRELGRIAPYVKTGLDAARGDMAFCFARGAPRDPDAPADPTILTLYLEAREGAIDVVESAVDHRGAARPELLECCREVLRGYEISAFGAVPGERYRLKYALE